jgi:hypothetical protein
MLQSYKTTTQTSFYLQINTSLIAQCPNSNQEQVTNQLFLQSLIYTQFRKWNANVSYQKFFAAIRNNQTYEELQTDISYILLREFMSKNYKDIFLKDEKSMRKIQGLEYSEKKLKEKFPLCFNDLLGPETYKTIISISELAEKLLEGQFESSFCLVSIQFSHHQVLKVSLAAMVISFYNFKLLQKKPSHHEEAFKKDTLPKITLITFVGPYFELDAVLLNEYSENVQLIVIYEQQDDTLSEMIDKVWKQNVLLLPLTGLIQSSSIVFLFRNYVLPAIKIFEPELVFFSHSFNMHPAKDNSTNMHAAKDNSTKISLYSHDLSYIVDSLCKLTNYKVIIIPEKVIEKDEYVGNSEIDNLKFSKSSTRKWNYDYFTKCVIKIFEGLTRMKTPTLSKHADDFSAFSVLKSISNDLSRYSTHPRYSFLIASEQARSFYKGLGKQIQLKSEQNFNSSNLICDNPFLSSVAMSNLRNYIWNEIYLADKRTKNEQNDESVLNKFDIKKYQLFYRDNIPFYWQRASQYLVDYETKNLFFFNVRFQEKYQNFEFNFQDACDQKRSLVTQCSIDLTPKKIILNLGLCYSEAKIFTAYGIDAETLIESSQISYYERKLKKWYVFQPKQSNVKLLPRHQVSCCYIKDQQRLYVFGGKLLNPHNSLEKYEAICNIVQWFTLDFGNQTYEYAHYDKKKSIDANFRPYCKSFALPQEKGILIIGGYHYKESCYEKLETTVQYFDTSEEKFTKTQHKYVTHPEIVIRGQPISTSYWSSSMNLFQVSPNQYCIIFPQRWTGEHNIKMNVIGVNKFDIERKDIICDSKVITLQDFFRESCWKKVQVDPGVNLQLDTPSTVFREIKVDKTSKDEEEEKEMTKINSPLTEESKQDLSFLPENSNLFLPCEFSLNETGSMIQISYANQESYSFKMVIWFQRRYTSFYLEDRQRTSLALSNHQLYLHVDSLIQKKFLLPLSKTKNYIFSANVSDSITKHCKVLVFSLFFCYQWNPPLSYRSLLVDHERIYLFGGCYPHTMKRQQKKITQLCISDRCHFFDISEINDKKKEVGILENENSDLIEFEPNQLERMPQRTGEVTSFQIPGYIILFNTFMSASLKIQVYHEDTQSWIQENMITCPYQIYNNMILSISLKKVQADNKFEIRIEQSHIKEDLFLSLKIISEDNYLEFKLILQESKSNGKA